MVKITTAINKPVFRLTFYLSKGVLFIVVLSKFLCSINLVGLLSGMGISVGNIEKTEISNKMKTDSTYVQAATIGTYNDYLYEDEGTSGNIVDKLLNDMEVKHLAVKSVDEIVHELYENDEENVEVVYNAYNLREKSNLSAEQIHGILEGSDLQVLADAYYEMENRYNVNALFLMALNIEESGHGNSYLAINKNNLGGVKSADGGWATFQNWDHSLDYIANLIDEMYLSEDGPYYNGTSIYDVNVRYCEGNQWAYNLDAIARELLQKVDYVNDNKNEI